VKKFRSRIIIWLAALTAAVAVGVVGIAYFNVMLEQKEEGLAVDRYTRTKVACQKFRASLLEMNKPFETMSETMLQETWVKCNPPVDVRISFYLQERVYIREGRVIAVVSGFYRPTAKNVFYLTEELEIEDGYVGELKRDVKDVK